MKVVNVAELKNNLSKYLRLVRAGEEVLIRDRNLPIARLVPLDLDDVSAEELELVAEGKLILPKKKLNVDEIMAIGKDYFESHPLTPKQIEAVMTVVSRQRQEEDDALIESFYAHEKKTK